MSYEELEKKVNDLENRIKKIERSNKIKKIFTIVYLVLAGIILIAGGILVFKFYGDLFNNEVFQGFYILKQYFL